MPANIYIQPIPSNHPFHFNRGDFKYYFADFVSLSCYLDYCDNLDYLDYLDYNLSLASLVSLVLLDLLEIRKR